MNRVSRTPKEKTSLFQKISFIIPICTLVNIMFMMFASRNEVILNYLSADFRIAILYLNIFLCLACFILFVICFTLLIKNKGPLNNRIIISVVLNIIVSFFAFCVISYSL